MTLDDVMTADPTTIEVGRPLSDAYALLERHDYHHLPVVDGDRPVGIIAMSDILSLVYDMETAPDDALRIYMDHQFTLDDAMSTDLRTIGTEGTVKDAAEALSDGRAHSVLVTDAVGDLAGIVTTTDLVRALATLV